MKKFFCTLCLMAVAAFCAVNLSAQISTPPPSPGAKIEQTVGLSKVTVEYSRPGMKGRTIFAEDGLVPHGKMWRTGANSATKVTFSDDVKVGGTDLKAGSYAIVTIPTATEWTVNFYPYESGSWSSYKEKEAAASVKAPVIKITGTIEWFMISVTDLGGESPKLEFLWDNTYVAVGFEINVKERVLAAIEKTLDGPSTNDYYAAASYYHSIGKDLDKALEWVQKATKVEKPRFWQVRREALILADLGKKADAIAAAKKSMELAKEAGNDDYVRMNEKSIAEWSK